MPRMRDLTLKDLGLEEEGVVVVCEALVRCC